MVGHYIEIEGYEVFGYSRYVDLYKAMVEKAADGDHFVEVGSFLGQSTCAMGYFIKQSKKLIKFDAVDLFELGDWSDEPHYEIVKQYGGDFYKAFLHNLEETKTKEYVTPIKNDSVTASQLYEPRSLNFVMIDAGHKTQEVINDIQAWLPKVKVGGYIAFDDIDWGSVKEAVDSLFYDNEIQIIGTTGIHLKTHHE
tara:strand:+ start:10349 stop:10936 length:588 start_codon:yes stop_codon:yes gene_type:complete